MKQWFVKILMCCIWLFSIVEVQAYKIISPLPYSIVQSDYIKFQLALEEDDPVPDSVFFIIRSKKLGEFRDTMSFRADEKYQYLFHCKTLVDNEYEVKARVWRNGEVQELGTSNDKFGYLVILDRNREPNALMLEAKYFAEDLKLGKGFDFKTNNNQVSFLPYWNEDSLHFQIFVRDEHVNVSEDYQKVEDGILDIWNWDGVEISFDLNNDKSEFRGLDDFEILISASGEMTGNVWEGSSSNSKRWGENVKVATQIFGSNNLNNDRDSGYLLQIAIPWSDFPGLPNSGDTIGFDIQNYDRDMVNDYAFRGSWSGVLRENNDNTSEWGNMILLPPPEKSFSKWMFFLFAIPLVIVIIWLTLSRRSSPEPVEEELGDIRIGEIKIIIAENYQNPELNRDFIARKMRIGSGYLSTLFNKETGQNLNAYLNEYRVEQSMVLLQDSKMTISEIAYEVGFNSDKYYLKIFKKLVGKTPSQYRETEVSR